MSLMSLMSLMSQQSGTGATSPQRCMGASPNLWPVFLPFTISDEPDPLTEDESDLCQIRSLAKSCKLFQFDIEEGE